MNRPPVKIVASKNLPDRSLAVPRPNGAQRLEIAHRLDSIEYSVVSTGGEEACSVRLASARGMGRLWLDSVGGRLTVFDRSAMRVWSGTIVTVEVNDGTQINSLTTEGMANSVRVAYTENGAAKTNTRALTNDSRALYYTRELIHSTGEMAQAEADNTRARLLQALAWPFENTVSGLTTNPSPGEASVAIMARGWWHALGWSIYSMKKSRRTGTTVPQTLIGNIIFLNAASTDLANYGNDNIPISTVGAGSLPSISYSGTTTERGSGPGSPALEWPITQGDETALETAERLLARGDSTGKKLAWGCGLRLYLASSVDTSVFSAKVWAGDSPSTITYYLKPPGQLLGPHLYPVPWTQARPDTMAQTLGSAVTVPRPSSTVDSGGRFWVNRTVYRWNRRQGEGLNLEPEGHQDATSVLARTR